MRLYLSPHRCPGCEIRKPLCFCAMIPRIALQTRVIILMHTCEEVLTTNTARLAAKALTNSEVRIHSRKDERMSSDGLVEPGRASLLLYPSPLSVELTPDFAARLSGPVNATAPSPATNYEFTKTLGKVLGRPTIFPMPAFAARWVLGEMANELLLASARVMPNRLCESGYEFRYPTLEGALRHLLEN